MTNIIGVLSFAVAVHCSFFDLPQPSEWLLNPGPNPTKNFTEREPIIELPGIGSSRLKYQFSKAHHSPKRSCPKKRTWARFWLTAQIIVPWELPCFVENARTHYNQTTHRFYNEKGVEVEPVDFGDLAGVENLFPPLHSFSIYEAMNKYLVKSGYTPNVDLFGAPFDFRLSIPSEMRQNGQYSTFKKLIERVHKTTGKRVHLIGHSLGGVFSHHFLSQEVTQEWKDEHIASLISLGTPFNGAPEAIASLIAPSDFGYGIDPTILYEALRGMAGLITMIPTEPAFESNTTIIKYGDLSFSSNNISKLLSLLGRTDILDARAFNLPFTTNKQHPNVTMHVLYSHRLLTPLTYALNATNPNAVPTITGVSDGDGTVPLASLLTMPTLWKTQTKTQKKLKLKPVKIYEFEGFSHSKMLVQREVWDNILSITSK
ncbi:putative Phosphatidylcholine-sterol acyltransferase [Blattamonas nauphoetae]|uniref:Phosphatidylcholine-sterol acyltransferase n=1 Tax=Blattamonas nauphoetae TaxID=2049346 RepID=A0ABQ9Y4T4_9EUKA|nr:putative Phosphatidylcholine-sterol acyltransferase [Blattamonas nauphoetae]